MGIKTLSMVIGLISQLVIIQAFLQCAKESSCRVSISNIDEAKEEFEKFNSVWNVKGVQLWTDGIDWKDADGNDSESHIFDPSWWSWFREDAGPHMDLPIDYSVLSLGLLSLRLRSIRINFESYPGNCLSELSDDCKRNLAVAALLDITNRTVNNESMNDEILCRSFYQQTSIITGNLVGVGKRCCTKGDLKRKGALRCRDKAADVVTSYDSMRVLVFIFGTILPLVTIPLAMAWAEFKPLHVGYRFADYMSNKLTKYSHFKMRGLPTFKALDQQFVVIKDDDLLRYEGSIAVSDMSEKQIPIRGDKIKFTLAFLLQYIPIGLWTYSYGQMKDVLRYLDSGEKIVFNLRYNPFSWLWTDSQYWPYSVAVFLLVINVIAFVSLIFWWLMELPAFRKAFFNCLSRRFVGSGKITRSQARHLSVSVPLESIMRRIFIAFFFLLMIGAYVVVFGIFHCVIFTIGGIIVNIDFVAAWLTGVLLVIYYVNKSYQGVSAKYTDIKRLIFEMCLRYKVYKGSQVLSCDVIIDDRDKKQMMDRDHQIVVYEMVRAEGPVVFYGGDYECMVPKRMFLKICQNIEPLRSSIRDASVSLVFTLLFLGLVVFTMAVFRAGATSGDEMSVLVTSLVTLLTALIPQFREMNKGQEDEQLEKDVLKFKIKKAVTSYRPTFRIIASRSPKSVRKSIMRKLSAGTREELDFDPALIAPTGTKELGNSNPYSENEFSNDNSSLPTLDRNLIGILNPNICNSRFSVIPSDDELGSRSGRPSSGKTHHSDIDNNSMDSGLMIIQIQDRNDGPLQKLSNVRFIDDSGSSEPTSPLMDETEV